MDRNGEILQILDSFVRNEVAGDECFCMILSLVGYDATRDHFLRAIDRLKLAHPQQYNVLVNIYCGYFDTSVPSIRLPDKLDCAVENGFYATDGDIGFDLDLELALKLSSEDKQGTFRTPASNTPLSYSKIAAANSSKETVKPVKETVQLTPEFSRLSERNSVREAVKVAGDSCSPLPVGLPHDEVQGKKRKKKGKKKGGVERPLSNPPVICWFRRDLRIYDNPMLVAACETGAPVIPLFLWSDAEEGMEQALATGGASKYWLHMALPALNADIQDKFNNSIIFRKADNYLKELAEIVQQTGARTLFVNDVYEPYLKTRDDKICKALKSKGVKCERFHSYLLHEPGSIRTESLCMRGIGSVTHFMECCRQSSTDPVGAPLDPPHSLPAGSLRPESMPFEDLGLGRLPHRKDGTIVSIVIK